MGAETRPSYLDPAARPGLFDGMLAIWRGAGFLAGHPRLLPFALIPVLINVVLFALFFYMSLSYFSHWLDSLIPQSETWYWIALIYLLTIIVIVLLLLIIAFTFTILANIIASPFNDALSAKTEVLASGVDTGAPFSLVGIIKETGRTIIEELKKLLFYGVVVGLLFLLNLIPVLGQTLWGILFMLFTVIWLGLSFLDYALARHGFRFRAKLGFVRRNLFPVLGYGAGVFAGLLIPVFNLAIIPIAVVGGTLLYLELRDDYE
ncbi:MAG: sulfate transporter CysZ [Proteobacteria bacterium]|nr:sulfate transporter CysZ [Pseudomonadota bacterium]